MVSDDSVQTLEIFEDFAGSLHSSASCHCNHYNHYYNHCTSFCMFLKIYCTILILLLALARTVPDWFHPMIFLFPRVSQFWDASHRSGESGECLGWFWSQQWFHRIIKTKPSLSIYYFCVFACFCLCLPLWLTREEKVESEEARQAGGGAGRWGRERKRLHWFYLLLLLRWAHNAAQTLNFGITWFYLVLCEM